MLSKRKVFIYVVARDFGFAPNPFHGVCSLATCKPRIRNSAQVGDWVFGLGGRALNATGKCIFAMKVTRKISLNDYWFSPEFKIKRPIRNGSKTTMLGDNIYHRDPVTNIWLQAHSHHSLPNGELNEYNLERDTKSTNVLLSNQFYYFGRSAPDIPPFILEYLDYRNQVGHRVYDHDNAELLVNWVESKFLSSINLVLADPFDFDKSRAHYSVDKNRITI